jgi:Transcriptional regulators
MGLEQEIGARFVSENHKMMVNVRYTSSVILHHQNKFVEEFDLTMPQFNILRILRGAKEPITVQTIKDRMIEKSPNTTRLLDKLMDKKLISRTQSENDRRSFFISITPKGLAILSDIDTKIEGSSLIPNILDNEEAILLNQLLDKLRAGYCSK